MNRTRHSIYDTYYKDIIPLSFTYILEGHAHLTFIPNSTVLLS